MSSPAQDDQVENGVIWLIVLSILTCIIIVCACVCAFFALRAHRRQQIMEGLGSKSPYASNRAPRLRRERRRMSTEGHSIRLSGINQYPHMSRVQSNLYGGGSGQRMSAVSDRSSTYSTHSTHSSRRNSGIAGPKFTSMSGGGNNRRSLNAALSVQELTMALGRQSDY